MMQPEWEINPVFELPLADGGRLYLDAAGVRKANRCVGPASPHSRPHLRPTWTALTLALPSPLQQRKDQAQHPCGSANRW
jgi:hypothetical protein